MCSEEVEVELRTKLSACGMATLVPEERIPRDSEGRALLSGWFRGERKKGLDRLIHDRRLLSETERKLQWAHLPHGMLFCRPRLEPHQGARGGGDDASCYFYHPGCPDEKVERSRCGRAVTRQTRFGWVGLVL